MSDLPENMYAKAADGQMNYIYESGQVEDADQGTKVLFQALNAVVQSNLAIAYEQRTENLIRLLENGYFELDDEEEVLKDIYQRVGKKL